MEPIVSSNIVKPQKDFAIETNKNINKEDSKIRKKIDQIRMDFSNYVQANPKLYRKFIYHKINPFEWRTVREDIEMNDEDLYSLQGNKQIMVAKELIIHIDDYLQSSQLNEETRSKFVKCRDVLIKAVELNEVMEDPDSKKYTLNFSKNIEKLKKGKVAEVLILGGTADHALVYKITKDPNNKCKFIFTIIDTDPKYGRTQVGHNYKTEINFENLDEKTLLEKAPTAIRAMKLQGLGGHVENSFMFAFNAPMSAVNKMRFKEQKAGICSSKSLTVWLHDLIGKGEHIRAYSEFKLFVLSKYQTQLNDGFQLEIPKTYKKSFLSKEKTILGNNPGKININFGFKVDKDLRAELDKKVHALTEKLKSDG